MELEKNEPVYLEPMELDTAHKDAAGTKNDFRKFFCARANTVQFLIFKNSDLFGLVKRRFLTKFFLKKEFIVEFFTLNVLTQLVP